MFHPDKHKGDKTDAANILFDRTKKAYEGESRFQLVLSMAFSEDIHKMTNHSLLPP